MAVDFELEKGKNGYSFRAQNAPGFAKVAVNIRMKKMSEDREEAHEVSDAVRCGNPCPLR